MEQPQDYTVEQAINRNKPDKFGNGTYDVKFREVQQMVYVASKTPPQVGDVKHGLIQSNEYGMRFKSVMRQDGAPQGNYQPKQTYTPKAPKKSDDERSDDIRWGLCVKEAAGYITKWQENLDADQWALQVNEYANALYKLSGGPDPEEKTEKLSMDEINDLMSQASDDLPL